MNNSTKTIIIPETDQERFIDFSRFEAGEEWFGHRVALGAICRHSQEYLVRYPNPKKFLVLVCGSGSLEVACDNYQSVMHSDDLLLMPPGKSQYLHALEPVKMIFLLVRDNGNWPRRPLTTKVSAKRFFELMELAWEESRSYGKVEPAREFDNAAVCRSIAELILTWVSREIHASPPGGGEGSRLRKLNELWSAIDRHPEEFWDASVMAKFCMISEPHLFVLVRQLFGNTPGGMLEGIRLKHAEELLRNTGLGVEEIALRCGYPVAYSFTRAFKRKFQTTPLLWRKQLR
ncbi:MAG: AraC family transcriptional regulator [Victivallaceae bacterium]|nr:AraC family transcriptional regulator [Victivallaceae bacterium]